MALRSSSWKISWLREKSIAGRCASTRAPCWANRSRAFSLMRGSDVLLLFPLTIGPGRFVGVKELEYFASGTPVQRT